MKKILFISPSTQDKWTWGLSIILGVLPVGFFGWKMLHHTIGFNHWSVSFIIFLSLIVTGFVATPYKYILTDTHLIIKRYWRDIQISLSDIQSIRQIPHSEKNALLRPFGYSGPFGYFGFFWLAKYSTVSVFARRYTNWTLIVTDRKKYVIAPDDLQLIDAMTQQIGKAEAGSQTMNMPVKRWYKFIPVVVVILVLAPVLMIYLEYKDPKFIIDSNTFKLKGGVYGVNIPFAGIIEADTIAWHEMPIISRRTNGFGLNKVRRGNFRTAGGDKIRLSVYRGVSPVIKIIDQNGVVYYINRKNADETREIYKRLKINI